MDHRGLVRGWQRAHVQLALHDGEADARKGEQDLCQIVLRQRHTLAARLVEEVAERRRTNECIERTA